MTQHVDWQLPGSDDEAIFGTAHLPGATPRGVLLIAHGFKGYKDYGLLPHLAEHASKQGLIAHRFNFSHSGMTRNVETFERPDLFERDTFSRQVEDLWTVAAAADAGQIAGEGLPQVWFGHSRGGVTSICAAGQLAKQAAETSVWTAAPVGLVSAAAPHEANNLDDAQSRMLRKAGRTASPSGRTGQTLFVGRDWLDDIEQAGDALDPVAMVKVGNWPVLIVHGGADVTVQAASARRLADAAGARARLEIIEGASHTFDCPNPLTLDQPLPGGAQRLVELVVGFAARCCGSG
ncbi:MAG: alpha/beta fold hydrolase [Phycisphaeraceae bacterium]